MHICDSFMRDDAEVALGEANFLPGRGKRLSFVDEHNRVTLVLPEPVLDRLCLALADRVPVRTLGGVAVRDESGV